MYDVHFIYGTRRIGRKDDRGKILMKVHFIDQYYDRNELKRNRFYVFTDGDICQKREDSLSVVQNGPPHMKDNMDLALTMFYVITMLKLQQRFMLVPFRILYSGFPTDMKIAPTGVHMERDEKPDAVYKEAEYEEMVDLTPPAQENEDGKNKQEPTPSPPGHVKSEPPSVSLMQSAAPKAPKVQRRVLKVDRPENLEHFQQIASNLVMISTDDASMLKGEVVFEGTEVPPGYHIVKPLDGKTDAQLRERGFWKNPHTECFHIPAIFPVGEYLLASIVYREKMLSGWWITNKGPFPRWEKYSDQRDLPSDVAVEYEVE